MTRSILVAGLLLGTGCDIETGWPGGTGVGNPGSTDVQSRKTGGVDLEHGESTLAELEIVRCPPEEPAITPVDRVVDLLGDGPFEVGGGEWCEVVVRFDAPLVYAGRGDDDDDDTDSGTFELVLDVPTVTMAGSGAFVDGGRYVLELGHKDWLEKDRLGGLEDGTHAVIDVAHPLHDELASSIASGSAIFEDLDEDGRVDGDERDEPFAAGPRWHDEEEEDHR